MIKVICFDLDGVYFTEQGKKSFHKALVDLTGEEDKVVQVLYKSNEMFDFVTGKMSENDFWNYVREFLSLELTNEQLSDLWVKDYQIDSSVRDVVLKVKNKGYLTAICSNNNPARIRALEDKFGFLKDFDIKVFSYEVGVVKPHKEIFEALIKQSEVEPSEIVYSDDNVTRIQGAKELGINTFVFEGFDQFLLELQKLGVKFDL